MAREPQGPTSPYFYVRIAHVDPRDPLKVAGNCGMREMRRTARLDQFQDDDAIAAERRRARVERRAYTVGQYCTALSVSRAKAYDMMRSGELPYFIIGGRRHISADTVEAQVRGELPGQAQPRPTRRRKQA